MAPPHFLGSRIHLRYSALLFPKNPSLYVKGSAATASAITLLHTITTAFNHHSLTSCTYLPHHELESVLIIVVNIVTHIHLLCNVLSFVQTCMHTKQALQVAICCCCFCCCTGHCRCHMADSCCEAECFI